MAAKKGNKYAEVWTIQTTSQALSAIEEEAKSEECLWLGSALSSVGLYRDIWRHWKEKFRDEPKVFRTIKRIEQIFEDRLFTKSLKGTVNPTVAIFGLKNNHEWTDKREIDHTTQGGKIPFTGFNFLPDDATDDDERGEAAT